MQKLDLYGSQSEWKIICLLVFNRRFRNNEDFAFIVIKLKCLSNMPTSFPD